MMAGNRRIRTEASISLTLAWDPTHPVDAADVPALQSFLLAFRGLVRVPRLAARGDVSLLEAALTSLPEPQLAPPATAALPAPDDGLTVKETADKHLYAAAIAECDGSVKRAAERLGVTPKTVHNVARRYGIPKGYAFRLTRPVSA